MLSSGAMSPQLPEPTSAWHDLPVLVTGASGFIGARLAARLSTLGACVTAVRSGRWRHQLDAWPAHRWRDVNLLDAAAVQALIAQERPAVVFHLAGVVNLARTPEVARACLTVNILGTHNLLDVLREYPVTRLLYASTTEIYGDNTPPFREDQMPRPPSPYAVSKLAGEHLCQLAWRVDRLPAVIARLTATYGPGQAPHRLVASVIQAALSSEPCEVSHAAQERDWLYVEDAVDGLLALVQCERAVGEIVNFGSTIRISQRTLVKRIQALTNSSIEVRFHERPARIGESPVWATDASRARDWCGWTPRSSLDEGLRETIAWYQGQLSQDANTK